MNPVGVVGAAVWLPPGRQAPPSPDAGYDALAVATTSGPDLAVRAGLSTLPQAGWDGADVDLLVHAWSHYQGHDFFSPAHQVADQVGAGGALPLGVQQMCNGGAAAVQTAVAYLHSGQATRALVTTGDRFSEPAFPRWTADYGVAYGDAGTSLALTSEPGEVPALWLRAIATTASPALEGMARGDDPVSPAPRWLRPSIDVRATKKAYLRDHPAGHFAAIERDKISEVVRRSLAAADLSPRDPTLFRVALPRLHSVVLDEVYRPLLATLTGAAPVDYGRATGHLGAGDLPANIACLLDDPDFAPGDSALVLSVGLGFTWSCAVLTRPVAH